MDHEKSHNVLTLRVPRDLKDRLEQTAEAQGVSMKQLAIYALARELNELATTTFFQNQHKYIRPDAILTSVDAVMAKVPARPLPEWDRIEKEVKKPAVKQGD